MKSPKKPSVFSEERECWICHSPVVHKHHVCGGVGRRPISEREGLWLYLCPYHHNMSDFGVHFDKQLDEAIKMEAQRRWEEREGIDEPNHESFIRLFYRSYL